MALLYVDDFENGALNVNINSVPNSNLFRTNMLLYSTQCYVRVIKGRLSNKAVVVYNYGGRRSSFWLPLELTLTETVTVGFAYALSGNLNCNPSAFTPSDSCVPVRFSASRSSRLIVNSDYSLSLGDLRTAPLIISDSVYAYLEVTINLADGSFELFVNNSSAGTGTVSFSGDKGVFFGSATEEGSGNHQFYDDIYILDDTGTTHNERLGPVRAVRVPFNSTTEANFTPFGTADNITAINKDSPNDSTFNRSPAANNVGDYFKLDASVLPSDRPIIAVQQSAMYRKTDIGERALKLVAKEGANRKEHLLPERLATFSGGPAQILETSADGSVWDLTNLAATDFGYEAS